MVDFHYRSLNWWTQDFFHQQYLSQLNMLHLTSMGVEVTVGLFPAKHEPLTSTLLVLSAARPKDDGMMGFLK